MNLVPHCHYRLVHSCSAHWPHTQIQLNTTVYFFKYEIGTKQGLFSKNISLPTKKLAPRAVLGYLLQR